MNAVRVRRYFGPGSLYPAAVVAAALVVYLNALGNGFALDDVPIIQENARVHDLRQLRDIWLTPYWPSFGAELGLWRPLAIFAYAVQWSFSGGDPMLFHAVSIVLHGAVTWLVFLLLRRLTATVPAFWGALLFAVHPVHTEAVANVVGQAELIAAAAMLGAVLLYADRPPGLHISRPRVLAVLVLFIIGILAKEHAVVLPGLLLATDFAQRRIPLSRSGALHWLQALLLPALLMAGVLLAWFAVRVDVLDGTPRGVQAGPQFHYLHGDDRVLNALRAFPEIIRLAVFPTSLAPDYSPAMILPVESVTAMVAIGAAMLAALLVLVALLPRMPAAGFPATWFVVSIITVSNLLFPVGVLIAERTLYLPSVATSAALAYAIFHFRRKLAPGRAHFATAAMLVVIAAGAAFTWQRNPDWRSTQSILYALMRDHPESYKAQWTHANWQDQLGHHDAALYHYELAVRIYPRDSQLLAEFAAFLIRQGNSERALPLLEQAFRIHPTVPGIVVQLGAAYLGEGRAEDALAMTRAARHAGADPAVVMPIVAAAYDAQGRADQGLAAWRQVVRHGSLSAAEWAAVASALLARGAADDAAAALHRGYQARPDSAATTLLDRVRQDAAGAGREVSRVP
jgi:protein O-mannosyl-transferase